jgi:hypothetical protein
MLTIDATSEYYKKKRKNNNLDTIFTFSFRAVFSQLSIV